MENTNTRSPVIRNLEDAADRMIELLSQLFKSNTILISVYGVSSDPLLRVFNREELTAPDTDGSAFFDPICSLITLNNNKPLLVADTHTQPASPALGFIHTRGVHSFIGVPLITEDGESLGTICLMDPAAGSHTKEDLDILSAMAYFFTYIMNLERKYEAVEQRSQSKLDLFAMLSHEIRTPMNGIISMTDLMMTTDMNEEQRYYMEIIESSNAKLLQFLNDVLDFSKMEAGKLFIEKEPFDIITALEESVYLFSTKAFEKNLEVILNVDSEIPLYVLGDAPKIRQIIMNIVSNALKFTHAGEILIELKSLPVRGEEVGIRIRVQDSGIGIAQDKLKRLFNKYTQVHQNSELHHYGGTGLGLAICRQLVELMGGEISAESEEGTGTRLEVTLYLEKYTSLPSIPFEKDVLDAIKILVVDDNLTSLQVISSVLEDWSVAVNSARTAGEALELVAANNDYDLILMDKDIAGTEATELAKHMRQLAPGRKLPVILLAPLGTNLDEETKAQFASIIIKPIRKVHLLNNILALLKHSKPES
ncbi:response regulator [Paenibacillus tritici]|uniref:histidine kinase n=1 Tax=Paenibacillus tritici TaxID=1873425 RepID=A0ABX2DY62_9BACL|nr:GAF domain-containing hybrid sensor histidine kinase/response regulator [Paenibacillus tritici]NQX49673.1 response regulator [Paenibacillus tritici]